MAAPRPRRNRRTAFSFLASDWAAGAAFVLFLVVTLVGIRPKALFGDIESALSTVQAGEGDMLKQAIYIALCGFVLVANIARRPGTLPARLPVAIVAFLCWAWLSMAWSSFPETAGRRLALMTIVIVTAFAAVRATGPQRALRLLARLFAVLLLCNLAAVAVLPGAIQQYDPQDMTSSAINTWRGLFIDKNAAGVVGAIQALTFMAMACAPGLRWPARAGWVALLALDMIFLFGTGSKTSMLLLVPVGAIAAGLTMLSGNRLAAAAIATATATAASLAIILYPDVLQSSAIALRDLLNSPRALTGRVEIWLVVLRYIHDNFWLGAGYGSFWATGYDGPVFRYTTGWILLQPNSHNGYLDLAVQLGAIGVALGVAAAFLAPLFGAIATPKIPANARWLILAAIIFTACHNMLEATYFNRDSPGWVLLVVMLAMLGEYRPADERHTARRRTPIRRTAQGPAGSGAAPA